MALQVKTEGVMEVDAKATEKCALNCEALDLALDEIIKSQSEKRAAATAGRDRQANRIPGKGMRKGVPAKAKGGRSRQEGRSLPKPVLSVAGRPLKKRGMQKTTRGTVQGGAKWKNKSGRGQPAANRVLVGQGDSYVIVAKPNVVRRPQIPRPIVGKRNKGPANSRGYASKAIGNRGGYHSQFPKRNFQNPRQNRQFERAGPQRMNLGVRAPGFKARNANGGMGTRKPTSVRGGMGGHRLRVQGNQSPTGLYEPPHRRSVGSGGGNRNFNHPPGVDFGWKKAGQAGNFGGNRSFGNQGRKIASGGGMRFGAKGRRGFRNSF
ncbi:hypothetical protein BSKO_10784 [Bryopsis sp. KO-2023]|nr:hypothetical protein BSKO_10784 [Bryopsis sp. KO-2023]